MRLLLAAGGSNGNAMPTDAQRRANAKQDATRKRVALWLEPADAKALEKIKRTERLPSRIAVLRWLLKQAMGGNG